VHSKSFTDSSAASIDVSDAIGDAAGGPPVEHLTLSACTGADFRYVAGELYQVMGVVTQYLCLAFTEVCDQMQQDP